MALDSPPQDEMAQLYASLMPALSQAAVGDFSTELSVDPAQPERVNELVMGVAVLLDVIREKEAELGQARAKLAQLSERRSGLLEELLRDPE